jgi:hypothetical protein
MRSTPRLEYTILSLYIEGEQPRRYVIASYILLHKWTQLIIASAPLWRFINIFFVCLRLLAVVPIVHNVAGTVYGNGRPLEG